MARHILLVEDSEYSRDATQQLLTFAGHRVSVAATVAEALASARRDRPDLVLVDLTLPDGEGLSIVQELKAGADAPVFVALTGHDEREIADECLRAGCAVVLVKPVDFKKLAATINRLLAQPGAADGTA